MTLVWDSRAAHSAVPCSLLPVIAKQGPEHDSCPLPMAGAAPSAQADPPPALQLPSSRCILQHPDGFSPSSPTPPAAPSPPAARPVHVADDGQVSGGLQDGEPDADAPCLLSHRPPVVTDALVGIQADLHTVVEQGEEGCQGTGCHKDGDEAKLQD